MTTASAVNAPTNTYLLNFQRGYINAPLLIYLPGLDETGKALISLQTASFEQDFNVRSLVIPPDDLDDWDLLAIAVIALVNNELAKMPQQMPVYLCAESFGGCLALKVLLKVQQQDQGLAPRKMGGLFERVILVNPASSFHRVLWLNLGSRLFSLVPAWLYELLSSLPVVNFLAPPDRLSPEARQGLLKSTRSAPKKTLQRRLALMRNFAVDEAKLSQIDCPVLLIGAQADRILPSVDEVYRLARIFPRSQVVILPYSGHACLVENGINLDQIMRAHHFMPPSAISSAIPPTISA